METARPTKSWFSTSMESPSVKNVNLWDSSNRCHVLAVCTLIALTKEQVLKLK